MSLDPYRIAVHPEDRNPPGAGLPPDLLSDPTNIAMSSEDEDDEGELADEEMGIEEHAEELLKGGLKIDREEIGKELAEFLADVTSDGEDFDEDIFGGVDEDDDEEGIEDKDEDMKDRGIPNGNKEDRESKEGSVASEVSQHSPRKSQTQTRKRSRTPDDDGRGWSTGPGSGSFESPGAVEDSGDEVSMGNTPDARLAKRQKTENERQSGLRAVVTPSSPDLPIVRDEIHEDGGRKEGDVGSSRIPSPPPSDEGGSSVKSVRTSIVVTGGEDGGGGNKGEEVKPGDSDDGDDDDGDSLFEELDEEAFAAALEEGFDS